MSEHGAFDAARAPDRIDLDPGAGGCASKDTMNEAARAAGIVRDGSDLESQGFAQVVVTRAARRVTASDMEAAVKLGLQERFGVDADPSGAGPVVGAVLVGVS